MEFKDFTLERANLEAGYFRFATQEIAIGNYKSIVIKAIITVEIYTQTKNDVMYVSIEDPTVYGGIIGSIRNTIRKELAAYKEQFVQVAYQAYGL